MSPKISIVVFTFQQANYLQQTLDSLLSQDFTDFEILVVTVKGDQETLNVLKQNTDPRIRIISANYASIAHQASLGCFAATGEYLMLFCSDDVLLPGMLMKYYNFSREHQTVVTYPLYYITDDNLKVERLEERPFVFDYDLLLKTCYITDVSFVRRREFVECIPMKFADGRRWIWNVWIKLTKKYQSRIKCLGEPTFLYRQHPKAIHITGQRLDVVTVARIGPSDIYSEIPCMSVEDLTHEHVGIVTHDPRVIRKHFNSLTFKRIVLHWIEPDEQMMDRLKHYPRVYNVASDSRILSLLLDYKLPNIRPRRRSQITAIGKHPECVDFALEESYFEGR